MKNWKLVFVLYGIGPHDKYVVGIFESESDAGAYAVGNNVPSWHIEPKPYHPA
jgi:hypothetical protein